MKYHGFLSYSHAADRKLAPALHGALHRLAKPWYRLRRIHIFRDQDSLSTDPSLWGAIEAALASSEYFLLMASPDAARSRWVRQEVSWWLANRSVDKLVIILTDGTAEWDDAANDFDWSRTTALPQELRARFQQEPLYVDLRGAKADGQLSADHPRFRDAVVNIGASLLGIPKDELDGEDVRQHRRARQLIGAVTATLAGLLVVAAVAMWEFLAERNVAVANEGVSLAALSGLALNDHHPVDAIQLALAAWPRQGDARRPQTRRVIGALVSALAAHLERVRLNGHRDAVRSAAFSPDGMHVVTASDDGTAVIWDARTGALVRTLTGHERGVNSAAFSPDGRYIVTGSADRTVRVWSAASGEVVQTLDAGAGVFSAVLNPDGTRIAAASDDGTARIWDIRTGRIAVTLAPHDGAVYAATFSPDGARIVTASQDQISRVWDAATGRFIVAMKGHGGRVRSAAFSRDGAR